MKNLDAGRQTTNKAKTQNSETDSATSSFPRKRESIGERTEEAQNFDFIQEFSSLRF